MNLLLLLLCVQEWSSLANAALQVAASSNNFKLIYDDGGSYKRGAANSRCDSLYGTNLAAIKTSSLQSEVATMLNDISWNSDAWIGAEDVSNTWQWPDGSSLSGYSNWEIDHPKGADCSLINANKKWQSANCNHKYTYFLCDYVPTSSPSGVCLHTTHSIT